MKQKIKNQPDDIDKIITLSKVTWSPEMAKKLMELIEEEGEKFPTKEDNEN